MVSTDTNSTHTAGSTADADGATGSYMPEALVQRCVDAVKDGVCELWLTSEDTGAYGRDIGTNIAELLWQMVDVLPEHVMLRLGMTNPPYILEHLDQISQVSTQRTRTLLHRAPTLLLLHCCKYIAACNTAYRCRHTTTKGASEWVAQVLRHPECTASYTCRSNRAATRSLRR